MALSTQPYKGARDFYPEDKRIQKFMFNQLRSSLERFGYEEYDAPILEPLEIYLAKSGEEIVNEQTYVFEDRGGRNVVIRPEMTPTVSRMVAAKRQELAYPLRWYSIPNLWRYERPQRGRLREHWQLNVDLFGIGDVSAELEVIQLADSLFKSYGATPDMFDIQLNSRQLINYILDDYLALPSEAAHAVAKLIDRMHKMERQVFVDAVHAHASAEQTDKLVHILDAKVLADLPEAIKFHEAAVQLEQVISQLQTVGITNVRYDSTLMRGFDYYTGIVFEISDTHPDNNRSMMGGGRYDGLVGLFGVEPVPTVGFGLGDVTLANFLELHDLLPKLTPETQLYVVLIGDVMQAAQAMIAELRAAGINVAVDLSGRKLGDQFKTAEKKGLVQVLIIGAKDIADSTYNLKNLTDGTEASLSLEQLIMRLTKTA